MAKRLEDLLLEEINRRRQKKGLKNVTYPLTFYNVRRIALGSFVLALFVFILWGRFSALLLPDEPVKQPKLTPSVTLPSTGILKQPSLIHYDNFEELYENFRQIRFFLRVPFLSEESSLSTSCGTEKGGFRSSHHYYIELLDWETNKVITTAFVRSGEMVEILAPFGIYKLRYATGIEWYGEKTLFGSDLMQEMTKKFSKESAKFELTQEKSGRDIGAYCSDGNLGTKTVKREM